MRRIFLFFLLSCMALTACGKAYQPVTVYNGPLPEVDILRGKRIIVVSPYHGYDMQARAEGQTLSLSDLNPERAQFRFMLVDALNKVGAEATLAEACDYPNSFYESSSKSLKTGIVLDYVITIEPERAVVGKQTITESKRRIASDMVKGVLTLGLNPTQGYTVSAHYNRDISVEDMNAPARTWNEVLESYAEEDITTFLSNKGHSEKEVTTKAQGYEIQYIITKLAAFASGQDV